MARNQSYNQILSLYIKTAKNLINYVKFNNVDLLIDKESIVKDADINNTRDYNEIYQEFKKYASEFVKYCDKLINHPNFCKKFERNDKNTTDNFYFIINNLCLLIPHKYKDDNFDLRTSSSYASENLVVFKSFNKALYQIITDSLSKDICPTLEELANDYNVAIENMIKFLINNNLVRGDNKTPTLLLYKAFFEAVDHKLDRDFECICDLFRDFKTYIKKYINSYNALVGSENFERKRDKIYNIFSYSIRNLYFAIPYPYYMKINDCLQDIIGSLSSFYSFNDIIISMLMEGRDN